MIRGILHWFGVPGFRKREPVVAVLRLSGVIADARSLSRQGLSLAWLADQIDRAFGVPHVAAVALAVNSPGGSAAQSSLIHKRIRALAAEKDVPVIAFAEDVAASGGYWLACAGDEIFADESSIIGSVGVISAGFGFAGLLRRLGVERRVHTSGERKSILDPFLLEDADDLEKLKSLQGGIHEAFKNLVREARGDRLKGTEEVLFSGEFWTGREALELGLIDGIGELSAVMKERYGDKVKFRNVTPRRGWLRRRFGLAGFRALPMTGGEPWIDGLIAAVEERALWGRFGL